MQVRLTNREGGGGRPKKAGTTIVQTLSDIIRAMGGLAKRSLGKPLTHVRRSRTIRANRQSTRKLAAVPVRGVSWGRSAFAPGKSFLRMSDSDQLPGNERRAKTGIGLRSLWDAGLKSLTSERTFSPRRTRRARRKGRGNVLGQGFVSIVAGLGGRFIALRSLWVMMLFAISSLPASAQIQQAWVAKYSNGITNGNHQALKMTLDSAGNIYVLGVSENANTNTGYAVVKYAPNGNQLWATRYDSTNYPSATPTGFALDSSNAVAVTGSAVTVKYDANGNQLWVSSNNAQAIAVDTGQNVYITGVGDSFVTMKLSAQASNIWRQTWSPTSLANVGEAIAVDSSSNTYVAGQETVPLYPSSYARMDTLKYDPNGNQLWEANNGSSDNTASIDIVGFMLDTNNNLYIEENDVGNVYARHYQTYGYRPDGPVFLYASDPTGTIASMSHGVARDKQGNLLVTGAYAYTYPFEYTYATYKLSTNGSYIWTNLYPSTLTGSSTATSITADQADCAYVTGFSTNATTGNDIITIKYDSNGNQIWLQRYDGPGHGNDAGNAIAVDNSGNVYVAGYETETNGFTSMILIKYSPVSLKRQANGDFILQASGSPGESFDVQASTNLETWEDLGDIVVDTNGLAEFDDTNAPLFPYRFYYTIPQ
jgi:hypothetical protein